MRTLLTTSFGVLPLLFGLAFVPTPARAAQSYDNCTGFVDSVPATISTQGTWCLRKDLSTGLTSGNAITISANNVTLDCNDFKLGGLAAGTASLAFGVSSPVDQAGQAIEKFNATVRRCNIRGFLAGVRLVGHGHVVEDNRLDNNLLYGIACVGCSVRRNQVMDTGGLIYEGAGYDTATGIFTNGSDVVDNLVEGVFAAAAVTVVRGISFTHPGQVARGNTVRGLEYAGGAGGGHAIGISSSFSTGRLIEGNFISAEDVTLGSSVAISGGGSACIDNTVYNYVTATQGCALESGTHHVSGL